LRKELGKWKGLEKESILGRPYSWSRRIALGLQGRRLRPATSDLAGKKVLKKKRQWEGGCDEVPVSSVKHSNVSERGGGRANNGANERKRGKKFIGSQLKVSREGICGERGPHLCVENRDPPTVHIEKYGGGQD